MKKLLLYSLMSLMLMPHVTQPWSWSGDLLRLSVTSVFKDAVQLGARLGSPYPCYPLNVEYDADGKPNIAKYYQDEAFREEQTMFEKLSNGDCFEGDSVHPNSSTKETRVRIFDRNQYDEACRIVDADVEPIMYHASVKDNFALKNAISGLCRKYGVDANHIYYRDTKGLDVQSSLKDGLSWYDVIYLDSTKPSFRRTMLHELVHILENDGNKRCFLQNCNLMKKSEINKWNRLKEKRCDILGATQSLDYVKEGINEFKRPHPNDYEDSKDGRDKFVDEFIDYYFKQATTHPTNRERALYHRKIYNDMKSGRLKKFDDQARCLREANRCWKGGLKQL